MLKNPTVEQLYNLRLEGMAQALLEQLRIPDIDSLCFDERFGLLVDKEATTRAARALKRRLQKAKLRHPACIEDIDFRAKRNLDRRLVLALANCSWIVDRNNVLITGPTGVGKTYLACALAHKACQEGHNVQYLRTSRLWADLAIAKADGTYQRLMTNLARCDLLVLDDWGLAPLTDEQRRDLLEILEDRHDIKSTIVTSQLPTTAWHEAIADPTLADAILDRLIHNAYNIDLQGESMRKHNATTPLNIKETDTPTET